MRKTHAVIVIFLLFVGTFVMSSILPEDAGATTLYVGGAGPGNYTSIQNAIFAARPGDIVFVFNGTYYENLEIYKTISLVGESTNNTTIDGGGVGDTIYVTGHWVNITGFTIINNGYGGEGYGIHVNNVDSCNISNSNVSTYRPGIYLYMTNKSVLVGNTVSSNRTGIYLFYDSNGNSMTGNNVSAGREGIHLRYSGNNTIVNNNVISSDYFGIKLDHSDGNNISSSSATSQYAGLYLYVSNYNTVSSGAFSNNGDAGILLSYSDGNIIVGNNASSNDNHGIVLASSDYNIVSSNSASLGKSGIELYYSLSNIVSANNVSSNSDYGIRVRDQTEFNRIEDNGISNNTEGIYLSLSNNNLVIDNNISSNSMRGIYIDSSQDNTIANNSVSDNGLGIYVYTSDDNMIYHNSIMNNLDQAYVNGGTNQWDNGYPWGGNYWSDYVGVDVMMGPNQDIPGSDGLGDTPYPIPLGNSDRYPLMSSPPPGPMLPSAPLNLTATAGDEQVALNWQPPLFYGRSPITNYSIYGGLTPGGEVFLAQVGNVLNYTDTGLINEQTYYYQVSAINGVGEGPRSNEANATPAGVPSAPQNLQAMVWDAQINLTWTPPVSDGGSEITNYRVYRGVVPDGGSFYAEVGNVTNYTDTNVSAGQTYYYRVSAVNAIGEGPQSNETNATLPTAPWPPRDLQAIPGDQQAMLSWLPPESDGGFPITSYRIYRGITPGMGTFLIEVGGFILNHTDVGLAKGQMYYYYVNAVNAIGEGPPSNEASAMIPTEPSQPRSLNTVPGDQQIMLNWIPPELDGGSPITSHRVYRGNVSGGESFLVEIGNVSTYTDMGLTNGLEYYYQVSAVNIAGEGPMSDEVSAIPVAIPSEPQNVQADAGDGYVDLSWSAPASDGGSPITNYRIYRGTTSGGETLYIQVPDVYGFRDASVTNGQIYYYQVSAMNAIGEGLRSNEVNAIPMPLPRKPSSVSAHLSGRNVENVTITWTLSPDDGAGSLTVVGYEVYSNMTYDADGAGYALVATLLNGTSIYVDEFAGEGDPNSYFYRVCAIDMRNNTECAPKQAGKFTRSLTSGLNLVSVPLLQSDESIETVLQTLSFDNVWFYDSLNQEWRSYMKFKLYETLGHLNCTMGVWVNITKQSNLTVAGTVPAQTVIQLHKGWNLVAYPSYSSTYTVGDLRAETGATRVEGLDPLAAPHFLRVLADGDTLQAGYGYWIRVEGDIAWVVSPS